MEDKQQRSMREVAFRQSYPYPEGRETASRKASGKCVFDCIHAQNMTSMEDKQKPSTIRIEDRECTCSFLKKKVVYATHALFLHETSHSASY